MIQFPRLLLLASLMLASCSGGDQSWEAGRFELGVDARGNVTRMGDRQSRENFHRPGSGSPLLTIRADGVDHAPIAARMRGDTLRLAYEGGRWADVLIQAKPSHLALGLAALSDPAAVDLVIWGPYATTLDEVIGETVGVVQGEGFAIGLQALSIKTLGGYPWNENDAMPQLDIFESGDFSDLSEAGKRYVLYRVEAAKPDSLGSTLQAYARNRAEDRVIPNMGYEQYLAPAFEDGGVIGSRIALFGVPAASALDAIGAVELAEGLPHPMLDGVWAKQSPRAAQAYVIMPFSEETIDAALDVVERAGMQVLYHPDPFASWGHFTLRQDDFPGGVAGLRAAVQRAEGRGLRVGAHTLSNFIHPHDAYVTPVPDDRLARVGVGALSGDITASQTTIPVAAIDLFREGEKSTLRTVRIGDELMQYGSASTAAPWRLLDVKRGAFGTAAAAHPSGSGAALLADHGYRVFLTDPDLSVEVAQNIADLFNETGLRHISFDGLEGNRSTGMGNYGEILFTQAWFDALLPGNQQDLIVTASRTSHFFWHLYTRMNWGEPWYAGFRESQTEYRMKNQAYFKRNLMPGMLGWFSMRAETSVEDIEWMLARSAAYDAGYAFYTSFEVLEANGRAGEILDLLARWERARLAGAFSTEQKRRMEDVSSEYHLEEIADGTWTLSPTLSIRETLEARDRQPGEPAFRTMALENPHEAQPLTLLVGVAEGTLTDLSIGMDGVTEIRIPVSLREGETLRYQDGEAEVFDARWQRLRGVPVDGEALEVGAGTHRLTLEADGLDRAAGATGTAALAKLEVRLAGPPERVAPDRD